MTDQTRLPDLIVRTTTCGDRFGWRLVTLEGDAFLTSMELSAQDGSPPDYETRQQARQAAGTHLLAMVRGQAAPATGEIVDMAIATTGTPRLAA